MKDLQIKKLYYSISEVSKMLGLEQYVLRYWETEFDQLRPQKNRAGNRIYTEKDIELVKLIKRLTRDEKYTIAGARQALGTLAVNGGEEQLPESGDAGQLTGETAARRAQTITARNDQAVGTLLAVRSALEDIVQKLQT